jgi:hypothetical protein
VREKIESGAVQPISLITPFPAKKSKPSPASPLSLDKVKAKIFNSTAKKVPTEPSAGTPAPEAEANHAAGKHDNGEAVPVETAHGAAKSAKVRFSTSVHLSQ